MNQFEIVAETREGHGTSDARRLRRTGRVPAVVYGGSEQPERLSLLLKDFDKQLENEAFFSHILTLKVGDQSVQVVLKALQRHPVSARVTHIDLLRVSQKQQLIMHVPLHFENEEVCVGRKAGGIITRHMNDLEVSCLPKDLPEYIAVDVAALDIGDIIHLEQVALPAGVELVTHGAEILESPVVSVHHAQKLDVEPEEGEEELDVEPPLVDEDEERDED